MTLWSRRVQGDAPVHNGDGLRFACAVPAGVRLAVIVEDRPREFFRMPPNRCRSFDSRIRHGDQRCAVQGYLPPAATIRSATCRACDSSDTWLDGNSIDVAPMRLAMKRWRPGSITRSWVEIA